MTRVVVDASALAALTFQEPQEEVVGNKLQGTRVFAPSLLRFELASVARKKVRQRPADAVRILTALTMVLDTDCDITWCDVDPTDVVLVAHATGLTTYDASYLWLAGSLGADLVTLDQRLAGAGSAAGPRPGSG